MNEHEKAIEELKSRAGRTLKTPLSEETASLAVEAMEKQIPQKIKTANLDFVIYGCPRCDFSDRLWSLGKHDNHCPNCGQALDWSKKNDD